MNSHDLREKKQNFGTRPQNFVFFSKIMRIHCLFYHNQRTCGLLCEFVFHHICLGQRSAFSLSRKHTNGSQFVFLWMLYMFYTSDELVLLSWWWNSNRRTRKIDHLGKTEKIVFTWWVCKVSLSGVDIGTWFYTVTENWKKRITVENEVEDSNMQVSKTQESNLFTDVNYEQIV